MNSLLNNWMHEVDDMVRSFSPTFLNPANEHGWFSPPVDIFESEQEYLFQFDLPGFSEKELKLSVLSKELKISGNRVQRQPTPKSQDQLKSANDSSRAHRSERLYGKFERSFLLAEEVDAEKIEAVFKDGVLEVRVPKAKMAAAAHQIPIRIDLRSH